MRDFVFLLVLLGVALWLLRRLFDRVTVLEYERGLRYEKGRFAGQLGPGQYWVYRSTSQVRKVDMRTRLAAVPGQEVLSADSIALKLSLAASYQVTDPEVAIHEVENYQDALYQVLQLALRDFVGQTRIDDLLEKRRELGTRLLAECTPRAEALGLRLLAVDVKDVMFPGELKKIFAQVVKAQKEGQAALERARGESAALRNLANAARLLEGNPALLQLRLAQLVGESTGNTVVLGMPAMGTPIPVRVPEQGSPGPEAGS